MLAEFKNAFIPKYLQKGQIYEKLFHDNLTDDHWTQITSSFDFLYSVHQTFSTNKLMASSNYHDSKNRNLFRVPGSKSKESTKIDNKRIQKIHDKHSKEVFKASPSKSPVLKMKDCKRIQLISSGHQDERIDSSSKTYLMPAHKNSIEAKD